MSNPVRKAKHHRARSQRKRDRRAEKRREAQAHKQTATKASRRAKTLQFPTSWGGLFQSRRGDARKAKVA